jgi:hypothetical protein
VTNVSGAPGAKASKLRMGCTAMRTYARSAGIPGPRVETGTGAVIVGSGLTVECSGKEIEVMATQKAAVDHTAISGASPPKSEFVGSMEAALGIKGEDAPKAAVGLISRIEKGKTFKPPRILLVGTEGIGKSTWAASAPKPIFIQTEDGLGSISCDKFPLSKTYADVVANLRALVSEKHDYQTIAIDSVDWLERLVFASVCERDPKGARSIETAFGGFAKGYTQALVEWQEILGLLGALREAGMAVILIAHAKIERFEDPENPAYDRYSPRLHKHSQALISEWVDAVLFATRRMTIRKEGSGFNERAVAAPVGAAGGDRILRTVGGPACFAKNRYDLQPEIPLSWAAFEAGLTDFMKKG